MTIRIAIVTADEDRGADMEALLTRAGHAVARFTQPRAFLEAVARGVHDLALIRDLAVIRELRSTPAGAQAPIILLDVAADDQALITGLMAGADDYVTPDTRPAVILARVAALLRRTVGWRRAADTAAAEVAFDPARKVVTLHGVENMLTETEFRLATLLFDNQHRPLARNYLIEAVWGPQARPGSRTLDTHLNRLKLKLGLTPERGYALGNVYGYGYRLCRTQVGPDRLAA